jgi:F/Y rich C-terminus/F/Y-rich N-terminus
MFPLFSYPSGYKITRTYANLKNLDKKSTYTCRILENGNFPRFEVMPDSNNPNSVISGPSTDYCHSRIIEAINKTPNLRKIDVRPQGDQFFGIDHPIISSLIKNFPNAAKCVNFKGLKVENYNIDKGQDPSLSWSALQRHRTNELHKISTSYNHAMAIEEIKSEPPEELF